MVSAVLDLVSSPAVLYTTVLLLLTIDAFIPVVPAQALMIGGGILSASGHVELLTLVLVGAAGVVAGDLLAFLVGRRLAGRGPGRLAARLPRRAQAVTERLTESMRRHIFLAVLFCRFVPAGRMITAMYAGRNGISTRRFASYDVVAATLWATYGAVLGHFGGEALASSSWVPLVLVGLGAVLFLAGAPLFGLARRRLVAARAARPAVAAGDAPRTGRICRRLSAMETLAAVEPMAAIEVMVAAEAVVVVESTRLEAAA